MNSKGRVEARKVLWALRAEMQAFDATQDCAVAEACSSWEVTLWEGANQWDFQYPQTEVLYHIRPYFGAISPLSKGCIWRYLEYQGMV